LLTRSENPDIQIFTKNCSGKESDMERDDFPQRLEREFVALVSGRADGRGYKKGEFAAKLWPWMHPKIAATRWNAIRDRAAHTGKPQNVTIADSQRMADALGEDLSYLMAVAKERARKLTTGKEQ
jgi:hypothetical protein